MAAIDIQIANGIAEIVLNRPQKKNALRHADWILLRETVEVIPSKAVRCVLVRGEGGCFSAGADLGETDPESVDARKTIEEIVNPALIAIRKIAIPTIAAVDGACLGGGFGIAMACDIVLAAEDALMGSPFRNIGIMVDAGGHYFLRERLGHHKASQLIYTGKIIDGREAYRLGLVCEAYPATSLIGEARAMATVVASGPTQAFVASKRILLEGTDYESMLALEALRQAEIFTTADAAEGLSAFSQKRKPVFVGS